MDQEKTTSYKVDEEGFADFTALERDWFFLQEMLRQQATLQVGIDRCKAALKKAMEDSGATGFKVHGVKCVTYKCDATFPVAKYVAANPGVADVYTKMEPVFDLAAFKRDRQDEYLLWRGRTFKFVQNGGGN